MLTVSKRVREGDVVVVRGQKIVRAGRRNKHILGAWTRGFTRTVLLQNGMVCSVNHPAGVVVQGPMVVRQESS